MIRKFSFPVLVLSLILSSATAFAVVKSIALDHLSALDQIIGLDEKTLRALRDPGTNPTMMIRDQNRRYMTLIDKIDATFGENPKWGSGEEYCKNSFGAAQQAWDAKLSYAKEQTRANKEWVEKETSTYKELRTACNDFLRKQK